MKTPKTDTYINGNNRKPEINPHTHGQLIYNKESKNM